MKNKVWILACMVLSGCVRAGDFDLLPVRRQLLNSITGYSVEFNKSDESFVGQETQREKDSALNKAITIRKGDTLFSDKALVNNTYHRVVYKPSQNGTIDNDAYPLRLSRTQEYSAIGWVTVDGTRYTLLDGGMDDYVVLFDENGHFFPKAGKIEGGVLKLLDGELFIYPSDLSMQKVTTQRSELDGVKFGYEVKYCGLQLDRLCFEYLEYEDDGQAGHFEQFYFPNKPGLISINGEGFRVLKADDAAISFVLLRSAD
jgi:hypothetical protein